MTPHINRALRIIKQAIQKLELNLEGEVVLTETGSGLFLFTPIIALLAGADKVFAWTRETSFGSAEDIIQECKHILLLEGIDENKICFSNEKRPEEHIKQATIITNSGHVRPLNAKFLSHVSAAAVIPLMYEKWELRNTDVDITFCKEKNIPVAGTNENHPDVRVFDFCEHLILKIAFEAGYEILKNKIIVWSTDDFGTLAQQGFLKMGAREVVLTTKIEDVYAHAADADFIFFCDYMSTRNLIGTSGEIDLHSLFLLNNNLGIVHLAGKIDNVFAKEKGFAIYPDKEGHAVRMTFTLAHIGFQPTLYLQAAGLKVGSLLRKNETSHPLVQLI
jgi:hypothetical protein